VRLGALLRHAGAEDPGEDGEPLDACYLDDLAAAFAAKHRDPEERDPDEEPDEEFLEQLFAGHEVG